MAKKTTKDMSETICRAAMELFAENGYYATGMVDIADKVGCDFNTLLRYYCSKDDILVTAFRRNDLEVLAPDDSGDPEESVRDRLFDLLMRRFDGLKPYRDALKASVKDRDPLLALGVATYQLRSMGWYLEAAGSSPNGPFGLLRVQALMAIWVRCFLVFLRDDSADLAKTMSALDKSLARAEYAARRFKSNCRRQAA